MLQGVNTITGAASTIDLDAQLMLRVRDGDEHSFTVLLEKHRNPVIHFVYRMVQDRAVAEELSQEVFLRVYKSRETYEPTARFTTWLFRIATHLALNWLRDGKKEKGTSGWMPRRDRRRMASFRRERFPTGGLRWSSKWYTIPGCRKSERRSPSCRKSSGPLF